MSGVIGFFLGAFIAGITVFIVMFGSEEEAYQNGFEDGKRSVRND